MLEWIRRNSRKTFLEDIFKLFKLFKSFLIDNGYQFNLIMRINHFTNRQMAQKKAKKFSQSVSQSECFHESIDYRDDPFF